jgi:hypothetical protein
MLRRLLFKLTGNRPARLIQREGHPYLERYYIGQAFGLTCYLHRFVGTDPDEGSHNHPWNALAVCLSGGYTESRMVTLCPITGWRSKYRTIFPGFFNWIRASDFHQIVTLKRETWTLFIHGKHKAGWGFLRKKPCDYGCSTHSMRVEFHQPFELQRASTPWWTRSPLGKDSEREEMA